MYAIAKIIAAGLLLSTSAMGIAETTRDGRRGPPWPLDAYKDYTNATCYSDLDANNRLLPFRNRVTGPMSTRICIQRCINGGHAFAGVEYGVECYCGDERPDQKWVQPGNWTWPTWGCWMACDGDNLEMCGGAQSLLVYEYIKPNETDPIPPQ